MKINTFHQVIMVLITLIFGIAVAQNIPPPFMFDGKIPGWIFWGIGFIIHLKYVAFMGIPDPKNSTEIDFFEFYIGMDEDDFQ